MNYLANLIDEIATRIALKKSLSQFTINSFEVRKTWRPYERLDNFQNIEGGVIVYIVGLASNDQTTESRSNASLKTIPIQIGLQKNLDDSTDYDEVKGLVNFDEQLRDMCRLEVSLDGYSWLRNDSLAEDDSGTPFAFVGLREVGMFEAYFTTFFNFVLDTE